MRIPSLLFSSTLRIPSILFSSSNKEHIIKNANVKPCVNCVYYKPSRFRKFVSEFSKCEKFGEKNIITGEINYIYADSCRNNEVKCGIEGKYFVQESYIKLKLKLLKNYLMRPSTMFWFIITVLNLWTSYRLIIQM